MRALVIVVMVGLLGGCAGASYFPAALSEVRQPCRYGVGRPVMDGFRSEWYSSHLRAAAEPRLGGVAPAHETEGLGVLRFTWLRSFDAPVIVRIDSTPDQGLKLTATELSGAGGYEPGEVARRLQRRLSAGEITELGALIAASGVLDLAAGDDCGIQEDGSMIVHADGAHWILEANGPDGYRFVDRWSAAGSVRDLGLHLIGLTGWTYDRVY